MESKLPRISELAFYCIMGTLYSYALASAVLASTVLQTPQAALLCFCAACILFFGVVMLNKYTFFAAFGLLAIALTVIFFYLRFYKFDVLWYQKLCDQVIDIIRLFSYKTAYHERFDLPVGFAAAFIAAFLTALNIRVHFNFYMLTLLALSVFFVQLYMDWKGSDIAAWIFIFCFLVFLATKMNLFTNYGEKGGAGRIYALALLPVCLLALLAARALPTPAAVPEIKVSPPNFRSSVDNIIYDFTPKRTATFSDNSARLGGPISLGNEFVMEVFADEPLYLSGGFKDAYTGSNWKRENDAKTPLEPDEKGSFNTTEYSGELLSSQQYYRRYYAGEHWETRSLTIDIKSSRAKTIFTPPFSSNLYVFDDVRLSKSNYGEISASRPLAPDTSYLQDYISWNYQSQYFEYVLRNSDSGNSESGGMERYLELPDSVTPRTRQLAQELTGGFDNNYDKLKAIENYLAQFPYTLTPETVPSGEDFVDYFLFTGKEGYCVYYASALAVMGRCAGIPTRYVEGYIMPRDKSSSNSYTVTSAQAHAWVEAFFHDFGWVRFEATAPYHAGIAPPPEIPGDASVPDELPEENPEPETSRTDELPEANPGGADPERAAAAKDSFVFTLIIVVIISALLVALSVRLMAARYNSSLKKLDLMPNKEAAVEYFSHILKAAGFFGTPIGKSETALEYAARIGASLPIGRPAEIFSKAAYSENEITDSERDELKKCYGDIVAKNREKCGNKANYFVNRYILSKF